MIEVSTLTGTTFILNCEHIEKIEHIPETVITLINGKKYLVKEDVEEVINRVIKYKNKIFNLHV
ncbi:flagellar FlbD family protein [Clostridium sp. UBA4548]|uniref:flagellar FlbD family protein n=1 Tax=Clostridium sp. UBA4548 TaxID=1946361 RepID=UPI0025BC80E8|nr:flagellar FlbD family protein [Clostridium sp. UBA4548]